MRPIQEHIWRATRVGAVGWPVFEHREAFLTPLGARVDTLKGLANTQLLHPRVRQEHMHALSQTQVQSPCMHEVEPLA